MKNKKLRKAILEYILAQPDQSISEYYLINAFERAGYNFKEISKTLFELKKSQLIESFNAGDPRISPTIYTLTDKAFNFFNNTIISKIKFIAAHPLFTAIIGVIVGSLITKLVG